MLSSESQSHPCAKPSVKSRCAIKCLIMLKEPLHSLLPDYDLRKTHTAFYLKYGFFKVFKCHESATMCPIRGTIAGSKHETQPVPRHTGITLQVLFTNPRGILISFLCHPRTWWEASDALSFARFRDDMREKKVKLWCCLQRLLFTSSTSD